MNLKVCVTALLLLSACSTVNSQNGKTMNVKHLTKAEFLKQVANYEAAPNEWVFLGDKPAIVDFYATWCGPCRSIAPILEQLADEYRGQIDVYKVDVDKQHELAAAFGVQSIPTLLFIPMKGNPQVMRGALSKQEFVELINRVLLQDNLINSK